MPAWKVENTKSSMIFDKTGSPINGVTLTVLLLPWEEYHEVEFASMDEDLVADTLNELLAQRVRLEELSQPLEEE